MPSFITSAGFTRTEQIIEVSTGRFLRNATYSMSKQTNWNFTTKPVGRRVQIIGGTPWRGQTSWYRSNAAYTYVPGHAETRSGNYLTKWDGVDAEISGRYNTTHSPGVQPGFSPRWDNNASNRSMVEAMLKLQDGKVNLGAALAESKTTVGFIAKTALDVLSAYKAARRKDWRSVARHLGIKPGGRANPGQGWLEYQYAWKPLLADIYDAYDTLQKGLSSNGQILKAVRVITDTVGNASSETVGTSTRKHRCTIWAKVKNATLHDMTAMGLTNPLAIAWELMPYSFVIDWMLPIGNVLSAATAALGLDFLSGSKSCSIEGSYMTSRGFSGGPSGGSKPGVRLSVKSYERVALVSFPLPRLYYKNPFSSSHAVSALALLNGLISRR